jgi:hypothetical protein
MNIVTFNLETSDFTPRAIILATSIQTQANVAIVCAALDRAVDENGYGDYFNNLPLDQIIQDLSTCDADCERMPLADVRAGVLAWKAGRS